MYKAFQDYVTDVALERNWKAYWNPAEGFTVEHESDNSEDGVEEISIERVVQAELEKFENLRNSFRPRETETAGLNFVIAAWWNDNVNKFPILAACAFRLLSVPDSGAPAER
eukprot:Pgem_evm1s10482